MSELRDELEAIKQVVEALRSGAADAFIANSGEVCRLADSEKPYITFFDAMNEGGVTIDDRGLILHSNPRFAAMLGRSLPELRGQSFFSYLAPEDRRRLPDVLAAKKEATLQAFLTSPTGLCPVQLAIREVQAGANKFYW